jgi:hypothetical protein
MELFRVLERDLSFPWFGHNWDALYDILGRAWGGSWGTPRLAIIHDDLPALGSTHTRIYVEVLRQAVEGRRDRQENPLLVTFPESVREQIETLLSN